jgi:hypothetical protein
MWRTLTRRDYLISGAILVVALAAAAVIYLEAGSAPDEIPWELTDESKRYRRSLEMYGGKANVLAVEIMDWFNGLWHGTNLAFSVAFLGAAVALVYLVLTGVARRARSEGGT